MQKVFTIVQRVVVGDDVARFHVGNRGAFLTNPKCTTAKREVEGTHKVALRVFAYNVEGVKPGDEKLYTIAIKSEVADGVLYEVADDKGYTSLTAASKALRAMGGGRKGVDDSLVIFSFPIADAPKPIPVILPWKVRVGEVDAIIKATSQAEANQIALNAVAGLD
jgi:hypothetical protein